MGRREGVGGGGSGRSHACPKPSSSMHAIYDVCYGEDAGFGANPYTSICLLCIIEKLDYPVLKIRGMQCYTSRRFLNAI